MSTLYTTDDLRKDALFRAGEPQDSTSSFWTKSLEYLTRVQRMLILGGGVAVGRDLATSAGIYAHLVDIPLTDWWWSRKTGVVQTKPAVTSRTITLTQGSTAATLSSAITSNVIGWRLQTGRLATVPRVTGQDGTALTLDAEWPEDSQSAASCVLWNPECELPGDFVRFAAQPYVHAGFSGSIPVSSREQQFSEWPISVPIQGQPTRAFLTGPQTIQVNTYDTRAYRLEFEYIAIPPDIHESTTPIVPLQYRHVLASGAAMLITFDKSDGRAAHLASEYRETVQRMVQEHRRALSGGSSTIGQFRVRERGLPQRAVQPMGELFLI
jgi:hypothetical protein